MMSNLRRVAKVLALVALVGLAVVSLGAQGGVAPMSAARSLEVQGKLAAIEADRAAFVSNLLGQWDSALGADYNLTRELGPMAMKLPAWQLYGASLVGDLPTMLRILNGTEGAGKYITSLAAPQPKLAMDSLDAPGDIGSYVDNLVYTPIAPCRMVDTRGTGARTGMLLSGAPRTFDLTTDGLAKGQGSVASCPGLPSYSHKAWAVNVTVTSFAGYGDVRAWPYGGTEPTASILNWSTGLYAIAAGQHLSGCDGCADDIVVKANGGSTHIIIDVVGYYTHAVAPAASTVSTLAGTPVSIANGNYGWIDGAACPAGTLLIGGELSSDGFDTSAADTKQFGAGWTFWVNNHDGVARSFTAYSKCMDAPVRRW
jgi:hypothetical protein